MMAIIKLSTVMTHSIHSYTLNLNDSVTVREIAEYLSLYESHLTVSTLEVARPIKPDQHLQDIDVQAGDRLVIFTQNVKHMELPTPFKSGNKILKFSLGDFEIVSRGKKGLLIGKSDESQQMLPDIDLRDFITPEAMEFISRGCLWLNFDDSTDTWYASKLGQTRVMIDEIELGADKFPLNDEQWLRFYRESDNPRSSHALGEMRLKLEELGLDNDVTSFKSGNRQLNVCVGSEKENQVVKASQSLQTGEIVTRLAHYQEISLPPDLQLYMVRLVSPETQILSVSLEEGVFLYTALNPHHARRSLRLYDVHNRERIFILPAGLEDDDKIIGWRTQSEESASQLDIDLYDVIANQEEDLLEEANTLIHFQGQIRHKFSEDTWWLRMDERSHIPMFVNDTRMISNSDIQLISGDVISIGDDVDHNYVRLEVTIT
jgi:hypothetical protein